ncbi:hypothetical protein M3S_J60 [Sorghum bicolor]|nr:hypothetical protein M3S_J60 [Sorghum bicolor]
MYGPEGVRFYTRAKAVMQRWPNTASAGAEFAACPALPRRCWCRKRQARCRNDQPSPARRKSNAGLHQKQQTLENQTVVDDRWRHTGSTGERQTTFGDTLCGAAGGAP